MNKGVNQTMAVFLSLLLVCVGLLTGDALAADTYARITGRCSAQVISVIDGDSMRVRLTQSGETALVRLLCVDATGNDEAFSYLTARLPGKHVTLETDVYVNDYTDRWNLVYMTYDGELINAEILRIGYAQLDYSHRSASRYRDLSQHETRARDDEVGRWSPEEPGSRYVYEGNGVNINTATAAQLDNIFTGIDSVIARNIVRFREKHPFQTIRDIKFVPGFTNTMFDNNRRYMTVSTNINTASREELRTLIDVTSKMVSDIIDYRDDDERYRRLSILYFEDHMPKDVYDENEPFMDVNTRSEIQYAVPNRIVNINTAPRGQLIEVGFSSGQADGVIKYRDRYGYKTIEELADVPGVLLSESKLNELADNLTVRTDINYASVTEIRSLLGASGSASTASAIEKGRRHRSLSELRDYVSDSVYEAFLPFVYINTSDAVPERVNLNTATREQLTRVGFTDAQARSIENSRPIEHSGDLPFNTQSLDGKIALYTNINEATYAELRTLSPKLTESLLDAIASYRQVQPFASQEELRGFFEDQFTNSVYRDIQKFVVFR